MKQLATILASAVTLAITTPAVAQDHSMQGIQGMNMPGMTMPKKRPPTKPAAAKKQAAQKRPASRRAGATPKKRASPAKPADRAMAPMPGMGHGTMQGMDHSAMPGMTRPANGAAGAQQTMPSEQSMPGMQMSGDQHSSHEMSAMPGMAVPGMAMEGVAQTGTALPAGNAPPPPLPTDHAADRVYGAEAMMIGRHHLQQHHGGGNFYQVMLNLAEYQFRNGRDGYRWDGEAWYGGDINRLFVKTEGEGAIGEGVESAEVQALYSRAIGPYFNLQGGVRQDLGPSPKRTYATVQIEGWAPGMFEVEGAAFLSNKGELLGRLEGYYDQRLTQRLILQPRIELNFAAQDVPENRIGSGLSNAELGLRLRYEARREFAPYIGVSWDRKVGATARFARAAGDNPSTKSIVAGVRLWF